MRKPPDRNAPQNAASSGRSGAADADWEAETIESLLGGIAHDLTDFLAAACGQIDLARSTSPSFAGAVDHLEKAMSACDRAASMARRLVRFGRGGAWASDPVALTAIVRPVVARALRNGIRLATAPTESGGPPVEIRGDPVQLEEALGALVELVRSVLPESEEIVLAHRSVRVEAAGGERPSWVRPGLYGRTEIRSGTVPFHDAFRGFFEAFRRNPESSRSERVLALVYAIVKRHRGYLHLERLETGGSAFAVDLPALDTSGFAPSPRTGKAPAAGSVILVVDDEPLVCELAVTALEEMGYQAVAATTFAEAVVRFEEARDRVSLLVTDLNLADGRGTDLVEALRARRRGLPAIVTSGDENPFVEDRAPEATAFLEKPFRLSRLGERVESLVGRADDQKTIS